MIREQNNPVAARAEIRRQQWEQARQAQPWWQKKRFDALDMMLILFGTNSLIIGLCGLLG